MRRMNEKHLLFLATARQKMPHPAAFFSPRFQKNLFGLFKVVSIVFTPRTRLI